MFNLDQKNTITLYGLKNTPNVEECPKFLNLPRLYKLQSFRTLIFSWPQTTEFPSLCFLRIF